MQQFDIQKAYDNTWYKRKCVWLYVATAVALIAAVLVMVLGIADVNGWHKAKGVLHIDQENKVITVTYTTAEGVEETATLHENNISWTDGSTVKIRYKTNDHSKVQSYSTDTTMGICLFVGAAMLAVLATNFLRDDRKRLQTLRAIAEKGTPVECEVVSVFHDVTAMGPKKKQTYRLECAFTPSDAGENAEGEKAPILVFMSEPFLNPSRAAFKGKVTTYVDLNNPDDYYVDVDSLQIEETKDDAPNGDAI